MNNKILLLRNFLSQLIQPKQHFLKADTGASGTFIKDDHKHYLKNVKSTFSAPQVHLPNNAILRPSQEGLLSLNDSQGEIDVKAYILPGMTNESLLSIGHICDNGYKAIFTN